MKANFRTRWHAIAMGMAMLIVSCDRPSPSTASALAVPAAEPVVTQASTTASSARLGDLRAAVMKAARAQQNVKSWRVRQASVAAGRTTERVIEYVAPDRYRMKMRNQELIIIGNKVYQNAGRWIDNPIMSAMVKPLRDESRRLPADVGDVKLIGPEVVNGTPTLVYGYNSTAKLGDQTVKSAVKLWVHAADGLPIKQEVEGTFAGVQSKTTQTIEYDPNIKIELPL